MSLPGDPDGARLWAVVTATVRPLPGRAAPAAPPPKAAPAGGAGRRVDVAQPAARHLPAPSKRPIGPPHAIEPGRRRQIERNPRHLGGEVDLHGHNESSARDLMTRYILSRHAEGGRSVLVVTGKGALGEGVLRRRVPDWLSQPPLREIVAGVSEAHRRHGGEGALYVALKRRVRA
jgi:DNA-nicking Smr family endonuclease